MIIDEESILLRANRNIRFPILPFRNIYVVRLALCLHTQISLPPDQTIWNTYGRMRGHPTKAKRHSKTRPAPDYICYFCSCVHLTVIYVMLISVCRVLWVIYFKGSDPCIFANRSSRWFKNSRLDIYKWRVLAPGLTFDKKIYSRFCAADGPAQLNAWLDFFSIAKMLSFRWFCWIDQRGKWKSGPMALLMGLWWVFECTNKQISCCVYSQYRGHIWLQTMQKRKTFA